MTSLATQLQQLAVAGSVHSRLKSATQRRRISYLFDPLEASLYDRDAFYDIGTSGLSALININDGFASFAESLFSERSKTLERSVTTAEENRKLDAEIERFLLSISPYCLLQGAHRALEWLVYRFRIHEHNYTALILCYLPYHETPEFVRALQLVDIKAPTEYWHWLASNQTQGAPLTKQVLSARLCDDPALLKLILDWFNRVVELHGAAVSRAVVWINFLVSTLSTGLRTAQQSAIKKPLNDRTLSLLVPHLLKMFKRDNKELRLAAILIAVQLCQTCSLKTKKLNKLCSAILKSSSHLDKPNEPYLAVATMVDAQRLVGRLDSKLLAHVRVDQLVAVDEQCSLTLRTPRFIRALLNGFVQDNYSEGFVKLIKRLSPPAQLVEVVLEDICKLFLRSAICITHEQNNDEDVAGSNSHLTAYADMLRACETLYRDQIEAVLGRLRELSRSENQYNIRQFLTDENGQLSCDLTRFDAALGILYSQLLSGRKYTSSSLDGDNAEPLLNIFLSMNHAEVSQRCAAIKLVTERLADFDAEFVMASLKSRLADDSHRVTLAAVRLGERAVADQLLDNTSKSTVVELLVAVVARWFGHRKANKLVLRAAELALNISKEIFEKDQKSGRHVGFAMLPLVFDYSDVGDHMNYGIESLASAMNEFTGVSTLPCDVRTLLSYVARQLDSDTAETFMTAVAKGVHPISNAHLPKSEAYEAIMDNFAVLLLLIRASRGDIGSVEALRCWLKRSRPTKLDAKTADKSIDLLNGFLSVTRTFHLTDEFWHSVVGKLASLASTIEVVQGQFSGLSACSSAVLDALIDCYVDSLLAVNYVHSTHFSWQKHVRWSAVASPVAVKLLQSAICSFLHKGLSAVERIAVLLSSAVRCHDLQRNSIALGALVLLRFSTDRVARFCKQGIRSITEESVLKVEAMELNDLEKLFDWPPFWGILSLRSSQNPPVRDAASQFIKRLINLARLLRVSSSQSNLFNGVELLKNMRPAKSVATCQAGDLFQSDSGEPAQAGLLLNVCVKLFCSSCPKEDVHVAVDVLQSCSFLRSASHVENLPFVRAIMDSLVGWTDLPKENRLRVVDYLGKILRSIEPSAYQDTSEKSPMDCWAKLIRSCLPDSLDVLCTDGQYGVFFSALSLDVKYRMVQLVYDVESEGLVPFEQTLLAIGCFGQIDGELIQRLWQSNGAASIQFVLRLTQDLLATKNLVSSEKVFKTLLDILGVLFSRLAERPMEDERTVENSDEPTKDSPKRARLEDESTSDVGEDENDEETSEKMSEFFVQQCLCSMRRLIEEPKNNVNREATELVLNVLTRCRGVQTQQACLSCVTSMATAATGRAREEVVAEIVALFAHLRAEYFAADFSFKALLRLISVTAPLISTVNVKLQVLQDFADRLPSTPASKRIILWSHLCRTVLPDASVLAAGPCLLKAALRRSVGSSRERSAQLEAAAHLVGGLFDGIASPEQRFRVAAMLLVHILLTTPNSWRALDQNGQADMAVLAAPLAGLSSADLFNTALFSDREVRQYVFFALKATADAICTVSRLEPHSCSSEVTMALDATIRLNVIYSNQAAVFQLASDETSSVSSDSSRGRFFSTIGRCVTKIRQHLVVAAADQSALAVLIELVEFHAGDLGQLYVSVVVSCFKEELSKNGAFRVSSQMTAKHWQNIISLLHCLVGLTKTFAENATIVAEVLSCARAPCRYLANKKGVAGTIDDQNLSALRRVIISLLTVCCHVVSENKLEDAQLCSETVLTLVECAAALQSATIAHLADVMVALSDASAVAQNEVAAGLGRLVACLHMILTPHLSDMLGITLQLNNSGDEEISPVLKILRSRMAVVFPSRVLLPPIRSRLEQTLSSAPDNVESIRFLAGLFNEHISRPIDRKLLETRSFQRTVANIYELLLSARARLDRSLLIDSLEETTLTGLVPFLLSLSEVSVKPLYLRYFSWASTDFERLELDVKRSTGSAPFERSQFEALANCVKTLLPFYKLTRRLASELQSLVMPLVACVLNNMCEILAIYSSRFHATIATVNADQVVKNEARQLVSEVLSALQVALLVDSEYGADDSDVEPFFSKQRFDVLMPTLLAQMENPLLLVDGSITEADSAEGRLVEETCSALLCSPAVDPLLRKCCHSAVLLRTRDPSDCVRLMAVRLLASAVQRLDTDYLPLMPEAMQYVVELCEDDREEIEREAHSLMVDFEKQLGQPVE